MISFIFLYAKKFYWNKRYFCKSTIFQRVRHSMLIYFQATFEFHSTTQKLHSITSGNGFKCLWQNFQVVSYIGTTSSVKHVENYTAAPPRNTFYTARHLSICRLQFYTDAVCSLSYSRLLFECYLTPLQQLHRFSLRNSAPPINVIFSHIKFK